MQREGEGEEEYATSSDSSAANWSEGEQSENSCNEGTDSSYSTESSELVISKKTGKILNAKGNGCIEHNVSEEIRKSSGNASETETENESTDSSDESSESRKASNANDANDANESNERRDKIKKIVSDVSDYKSLMPALKELKIEPVPIGSKVFYFQTYQSYDSWDNDKVFDFDEKYDHYFKTVERPKDNVNFNWHFNESFFGDNDEDGQSDDIDDIDECLIYFEKKIDKCIDMIDEVDVDVKRLFGQLSLNDELMVVVHRVIRWDRDTMHANSHRHHQLL